MAVGSTGNTSLHAARKAKNDEFYTRIEDVEAELYHYRDHFHDKTVYLNCDDPRWSAFWRYFALNFQHLGLKRLLATHYTGVVAPGQPSFMLEILRGRDEDPETGRIDVDSGVQSPLRGDGDFRSDECVELLKQSDVVVTNPPFSLFREYVAQLVEHGKKFVIIGNTNAITYKEIWPLIESGKMWLGTTYPKRFLVPSDSLFAPSQIIDEGVRYQQFGNISWFTNLDHAKRHEELPLWKRYTPEEYPRYDNYNAINVNRVKDIPVDYDGAIGVPITFLDKWNPEQFEILGISEQNVSGGSGALWDANSGVKHPLIGGAKTYARILVRAVVSEPGL